MLQAELRKKVDWDCPKLQLPHGTTVSLQYFSKSSQQKHQIPLTVSPHSNVFYALFNEDDVDFEIVVDNTSCKNNDVCIELSLQNKSYGFLVKRGLSTTFTTVVSEGGKFHFISQSGPEGQALVAEAAMDHEMSFASAEVLVSRITFGFKYSPWKQEVIKLILVDCFQDGKETPFYMNPSDSVAALKTKIEKKTGYHASYFRLVFDRRVIMQDGKKLSDYDMKNDDKIDMLRELRGGGDYNSDYYLEMERISTAPKAEYFLGLGAGVGVGERGVVCLDEASTQRFQPAHFDEDKSVCIQPFIVEMRMASKFRLFI